MNNAAELFKYTLAAGATQAVNSTGTKLFVRSALQPFTVKFDTGAQIEVEDGFRFTSEKQFSRLQVTNNNAAALYLEFYVSDARVERDAPQYMREGATTFGGNTGRYQPTAGLATLFPGAALGKHRKHFVVSNGHATADLTLRTNLAGNVLGLAFAIVPAGTSYVVESSDDIWIENKTGAANGPAFSGNVYYYVEELFYS